jgi:hypothetical protein
MHLQGNFFRKVVWRTPVHRVHAVHYTKQSASYLVQATLRKKSPVYVWFSIGVWIPERCWNIIRKISDAAVTVCATNWWRRNLIPQHTESGTDSSSSVLTWFGRLHQMHRTSFHTNCIQGSWILFAVRVTLKYEPRLVRNRLDKGSPFGERHTVLISPVTPKLYLTLKVDNIITEQRTLILLV